MADSDNEIRDLRIWRNRGKAWRRDRSSTTPLNAEGSAIGGKVLTAMYISFERAFFAYFLRQVLCIKYSGIELW